jgi:hypothetical protein
MKADTHPSVGNGHTPVLMKYMNPVLFILLQFNPSRGSLTTPYSSVERANPAYMEVLLILFVLFCLYVAVRVWLSMINDNKGRGPRKKVKAKK